MLYTKRSADPDFPLQFIIQKLAGCGSFAAIKFTKIFCKIRGIQFWNTRFQVARLMRFFVNILSENMQTSYLSNFFTPAHFQKIDILPPKRAFSFISLEL